MHISVYKYFEAIRDHDQIDWAMNANSSSCLIWHRFFTAAICCTFIKKPTFYPGHWRMYVSSTATEILTCDMLYEHNICAFINKHPHSDSFFINSKNCHSFFRSWHSHVQHNNQPVSALSTHYTHWTSFSQHFMYLCYKLMGLATGDQQSIHHTTSYCYNPIYINTKLINLNVYSKSKHWQVTHWHWIHSCSFSQSQK